MIIGALPFAKYVDLKATLAPGTKLFVLSDGCYEIFDRDRNMMELEGLTKILAEASPHPDALDRTVDAVRQYQNRPDFDDDFSLVQFHL
jgi:serine phosphatase RsbU (regulator of sigma subunit)